MKYLDLKQNLKQDIAPVYTIYGDDQFLITTAVKLFKKNVLTQAADLNFNNFEAENFDAKIITETAQQLPFLSDKRLVVCYMPEKIKKDELKVLESYSNQPNPTTCLVLVDKDKNSSFGVLIDCNKLDVQSLLKLAANFANKYNKSIGIETAKALIDRCDRDAQRLYNEIDKLCNYSDQKIIAIQDVDTLVKKDLQFEVFKLLDYVANKNKTEAIKLISILIDTKQDCAGVITLLSNTFRRIFYSKISDLSDNDLAQKMGVKPFAITKARGYAKSFSQKQLKKILELCEDLDFLLKQGQITSENALFVLIFTIFLY